MVNEVFFRSVCCSLNTVPGPIQISQSARSNFSTFIIRQLFKNNRLLFSLLLSENFNGDIVVMDGTVIMEGNPPFPIPCSH